MTVILWWGGHSCLPRADRGGIFGSHPRPPDLLRKTDRNVCPPGLME
jgi:hypothetical protein